MLRRLVEDAKNEQVERERAKAWVALPWSPLFCLLGTVAFQLP